MSDAAHWFGGDLQLSASGDLLIATGVTESEQRVLRRVMTNQGDYFWSPDYGGGLPGYIGSTINANQVQSTIYGQMQLESSVAQSPAPQVTVTPIAEGMFVAMAWATQNTPAALNFSVTP
jgi:hypothetical protein